MRKYNKQILFFLLMILLGLMFSSLYMVLQSENEHTELSTVYKQQSELMSLENTQEQLIKEKELLISEIDQYKNKNEEEIIEGLNKQLDDLRKVSGLTDLKGPGVIVIINDSTVNYEGQREASSLIVHDFDIQNIITDLRNSGAEAISVNGERVIAGKSKIKCAGPTIQINEKVVGQPFIIKAIGDKYFLEAAINSPDGYGNILRQWDIFIEVNTSVNVTVPAYDGTLAFRYLKNYEEEE